MKTHLNCLVYRLGPQKLQPCQEVKILFKTFSWFYLTIFTVTEREALMESKAKFVELQKIAVNKPELTEEKKAYELAEKEALEAQKGNQMTIYI